MTDPKTELTVLTPTSPRASELFFLRLVCMAQRIAPDYPFHSPVSPDELLWIIEQSYRGLQLANEDLHDIIEKGMTKEEFLRLSTEQLMERRAKPSKAD